MRTGILQKRNFGETKLISLIFILISSIYTNAVIAGPEDDKPNVDPPISVGGSAGADVGSILTGQGDVPQCVAALLEQLQEKLSNSPSSVTPEYLLQISQLQQIAADAASPENQLQQQRAPQLSLSLGQGMGIFTEEGGKTLTLVRNDLNGGSSNVEMLEGSEIVGQPYTVGGFIVIHTQEKDLLGYGSQYLNIISIGRGRLESFSFGPAEKLKVRDIPDGKGKVFVTKNFVFGISHSLAVRKEVQDYGTSTSFVPWKFERSHDQFADVDFEDGKGVGLPLLRVKLVSKNDGRVRGFAFLNYEVPAEREKPINPKSMAALDSDVYAMGFGHNTPTILKAKALFVTDPGRNKFAILPLPKARGRFLIATTSHDSSKLIKYEYTPGLRDSFREQTFNGKIIDPQTIDCSAEGVAKVGLEAAVQWPYLSACSFRFLKRSTTHLMLFHGKNNFLSSLGSSGKKQIHFHLLEKPVIWNEDQRTCRLVASKRIETDESSDEYSHSYELSFSFGKKGKSGGGKDRNFTVDSSQPPKSVSFSHELFPGAKELAFVQYKNQPNTINPTALIDLRTQQVALVPGIQRVEKVSVRGKPHYVIFGQASFHGEVETYVTIYNVNEGLFLLLGDGVTSDLIETVSAANQLVVMPGAGAYRLPSLKTPVEEIILNYRDREKLFTFSGKLEDGKYEDLEFQVQLRNEPYIRALYNPYNPTFARGRKPKGYLRVAEAITDGGHPIEIEEITEAPQVSDVIHYQPVPSTGVAASQKMTVPGRMERVTLSRNGEHLHCEGKRYSLTTSVPVSFDWQIGGEVTNLIVNPQENTIYPDDGEYELTATDAAPGEIPRLFIRKSNSEKLTEVRLAFNFNKDEIDPASVVLFSMSHGLTVNQTMGLTIEPNELPIVKVTRDSENNLFYIKTQKDKGSDSLTYVYSIQNQRMEFAIPNLDVERTLDLGDFRFYIGKSSYNHPARVIVFDQSNHRFVTSFDFGQADISADEGSIWQDEAKSLIYFKTQEGLVRVFNEKTKNFMGLIPDEIMEIVEPVATQMGSVANNEIFRNPERRVVGRDEEFKRLQSEYPMRTATGLRARRILVSGLSKSGRTSFVNDYIAQYLGGEIDPAPDLNVIFFRLDSAALKGNTKYRGTQSDKFNALSKLATDLRAKGYHLCIVVDDLEDFPANPDHRDSDENPIKDFQNLITTHGIDVIATIDASAQDVMSRQHDGLISVFTERVRLDPMSPVKTAEAVHRWVQARYPQNPPITPVQVRRLIHTMENIPSRGAFPGTVFSVIDSAYTNAKAKTSVGQPIVISDDELDQKLAQETGIPAMFFDDDVAARIDELKTFLEKRVKGQPLAIAAMIKKITTFAVRLKRGDWPVFNFLELGPTGVGKTEIFKALAEFLFGDKKTLLIIPGAQYQAGTPTSRLVKQISDHIKAYPFCGILFDEFEKLPPDARNIVLSLAENNFVDENQQNVPSGLVMLGATSNVGAKKVAQLARGEGKIALRRLDGVDLDKEIRIAIEDAMEEEFPPELINRFDDWIYFKHLSQDVIREIATEYFVSSDPALNPNSVTSRCLREGLSLEFDDSVINHVATSMDYFDEELGGRRFVKEVENRFMDGFLSEERLRGRIVQGRHYKITWEDDQFKSEDIGEADSSIGNSLTLGLGTQTEESRPFAVSASSGRKTPSGDAEDGN